MDLTTPEAIGGAGVTMGGMLLLSLIRMMGQASKFMESVSGIAAKFSKWLDLQIEANEAQLKSLKDEQELREETRKHYRRSEELSQRNNQHIEDLRRTLLAVPRMIHDDVTPPPYSLDKG